MATVVGVEGVACEAEGTGLELGNCEGRGVACEAVGTVAELEGRDGRGVDAVAV